jgi:hypothetical protein
VDAIWETEFFFMWKPHITLAMCAMTVLFWVLFVIFLFDFGTEIDDITDLYKLFNDQDLEGKTLVVSFGVVFLLESVSDIMIFNFHNKVLLTGSVPIENTPWSQRAIKLSLIKVLFDLITLALILEVSLKISNVSCILSIIFNVLGLLVSLSYCHKTIFRNNHSLKYHMRSLKKNLFHKWLSINVLFVNFLLLYLNAEKIDFGQVISNLSLRTQVLMGFQVLSFGIGTVLFSLLITYHVRIETGEAIGLTSYDELVVYLNTLTTNNLKGDWGNSSPFGLVSPYNTRSTSPKFQLMVE